MKVASLRGLYRGMRVLRIRSAIWEACQQAGLTTVILFGSMARGQATCRSDVDLAVAPLDQFTESRLLQLEEMLMEIVGREVDVFPLERANPYVAVAIAQEGIPLNNWRSSWLGWFGNIWAPVWQKLRAKAHIG